MNEEIKEILYYFEKYHFEDTMIDGKETKLLYDYITNLQNQLQQKENIIKEVRLYIYNHREPVDEKNQKIIYFLTDDFDEEDILEILDKVDKEK